MLDLLTSGLSVVFAPKMFILIIFAVFLGTLFGALPGVSATMAVTLGIPFTYKMDAVSAIAFLVAIYCASITGGGMTAILFKIPGVPSSAPTTYDGYPMAQRGEAGKALGVQLIASAIGGMFAAVCMLIFSPQLTQAALSFGPSELFAISFMGLSILTSLEEGNVCRTIISGLLGLLLACIGLDPLLGVPRLTFGTRFLTSGIEMIPVMIGFFAVTEVLKQTNKPSKLKAVTGQATPGLFAYRQGRQGGYVCQNAYPERNVEPEGCHRPLLHPRHGHWHPARCRRHHRFVPLLLGRAEDLQAP